MEKMKTYFCLIRSLQPTLSEAGNQVLLRYYQMQRQSDSRNAARTTIRLLESLIRLAEAHARLMFRDTVTLEDAITVVSVMESSMQGGALLGGVNALHTSFPENPLEQYQRQCELILERLELHNLLSEELRRLERLQNQSVNQSLPRAVEAESAPGGSSRNDPGEESRFRMSTQQEVNCSTHTSYTGGCPRGSPLLDPLPHLGPNRPTSRKYSAQPKEGRDDGLDWFDSMETHQIEPQNTVSVSPGLKTTGRKMALKNSSKYKGKEKSEPIQRNKLETGQPPAPGETEAPLRPESVEGKKEKKATVVAETSGTAGEPDSVLTHHVPRKLHRLRKERAQELCRNPSTRVPSQTTSPSHPPSTPAHSPERMLETPRRKRKKSLPQVKEPEPESVESLVPPVAKLAKFTFKHKSKLIHSREGYSRMSPHTTDIAVQSLKISQHGTKGDAALPVKGPEKLTSASGNGSSDQLRRRATHVSRQPPEKDESREERERASGKRVWQPESELRDETGHLHPTCERDKKEEFSCNNKSSKVHACTLAKLAGFSFTSSSESKSESLPPSESENWQERGLSSPLVTTTTMLGRRRETFQLEGSTERFSLSKKSLFTLPELEDESLDFDWDEEMRKKP